MKNVKRGQRTFLPDRDDHFAGPEVRGKTSGVIGLGAIGAMVANAASNGLGMEVVGEGVTVAAKL